MFLKRPNVSSLSQTARREFDMLEYSYRNASSKDKLLWLIGHWQNYQFYKENNYLYEFISPRDYKYMEKRWNKLLSDYGKDKIIQDSLEQLRKLMSQWQKFFNGQPPFSFEDEEDLDIDKIDQCYWGYRALQALGVQDLEDVRRGINYLSSMLWQALQKMNKQTSIWWPPEVDKSPIDMWWFHTSKCDFTKPAPEIK